MRGNAKLRDKLTYANVISTLCLFLLLGGGAAFAASQLGKNTVGTKQLKKNAVTTAKIKNQAVKSAKLADGAVTAAKLAPGVAISGPPGPPGAPAGGSTTRSFSFRTSADETVNNLVQAGGLTIDVSCTGTVLTATARTSVDNSSIFTASIDTANSADPVTNQENDSDFDIEDFRGLLLEDMNLQIGHTSYAAGTNGPVVNVQWSSAVGTGNFDCLFVGQVTVG
jgi:hypothetical protein